MSRTDGRKIVTLAFAGIVGAIGLGQIYLPYIADRDKLRGLFEEEDMPVQARREIDMIMKAERAAELAKQKTQSTGSDSETEGSGSNGKRSSAGSMWSNLRR